VKSTVEPHKQIITKGDFLDIFLFEYIRKYLFFSILKGFIIIQVIFIKPNLVGPPGLGFKKINLKWSSLLNGKTYNL